MSGMEDIVMEEESPDVTETTTEEQKIQRPLDVVHVHVYRGNFATEIPSKQDMSALVITRAGEVYGTGRNTLIGWEKSPSPMQMKEDGPDVLKDYVKVEALSGLGLTKVVVGFGFGAALTQDNQMYFWGGGPRMLGNDAVVMVQEYKAGRPCHCGNSEGGEGRSKGGADLLGCPHYGYPEYKSYTASSPPPAGISVKRFVKFDSDIHLSCCKCGRTCTSKEFDRFYFNYCENCDLYREVLSTDVLPPHLTVLPHKLLAGIADIDCGLTFLCALSDIHKVTLWGWKTFGKYEIPVGTPENVTIKALNCGKSHFAAISEPGGLYMFGNTKAESVHLGSDANKHRITLNKVTTPGVVEKVCCGDEVTLCLLSDHSIWFFGVDSSMQILKGSSFSGWEISDISTYHHLNTFFLRGKSMAPSVEGQFRNVRWKIHQSNVNCNRSLMDSIRPHDVSVEDSPAQNSEQVISSLLSWQKDLFGKKQLTDMTLKLADGDFPAHRFVLFGSSNYFKNIFTNQETTSTLDMTSYNPRAYKVLLQYFYQLQPDDLELDDLLDLHYIATSYNEPDIVNDVISQLKSLINIDNVLQILAKAKSTNNNALVEECEKTISSPAFEDKVLSAIIEDPAKCQVIFENRFQ